MVEIGHEDVPEVNYRPRSGRAMGVEVVSLAELSRRMRSHSPSPRAERPDFHLLLTVDDGVIWHMVDFYEYALSDGAWLWVRPGQVQRFGDLSNATGTVVMFPADAVSADIATELALDDPFGRTLWIPNSADASALPHALEHLTAEFHAADVSAGTHTAILRLLLTVLLLRLTDRAAAAGTVQGEHSDTFLRFRAAVEKNFARHHDVAYYARGLGYAPRTLTRATVDAAGVGAKEFIDRRIILEAKRLLAHTDDPVAAIAARLGFFDASNFVKYISLRAGATPTAFRQQFRSSTGTVSRQPDA